MRKTAATKPIERSEEAILDQATRQLLGAIKEDAEKKGKPLTREELRREGYSERFIDKVENA